MARMYVAGNVELDDEKNSDKDVSGNAVGLQCGT